MKTVDKIQFIPVHGSKSNMRLQNCTIEQNRERKLDLGGFAVNYFDGKEQLRRMDHSRINRICRSAQST